MRVVRALALGLAAAVPAQEVAFAAQVLPILEQHCFECHRGEYTDASGRLRKPKGGLRLDGKAWIAKGGKEGAVLTAGSAEQSPMYTRTVLPADHDDRMPASGDPLSREQTEVLRRWIDGGAAFGAWVGAEKPAEAPAAPTPPAAADGAAVSPVNARTVDLARVAAGLTPLPESTIARAAGGKARVTPLWHGSALLHVEFAGEEDRVVDQDVAALAPLAGHVAELVLARTKVTDAACTHLARMRRLVRLDLRDTRITDAGVARLAALPELRALNLFATDVSDASAPVWRELPKLEELRLWQTRVTPAGLAALRQTRPALDASLGPDLPPPAPAGQGQRGRRRGR